MTEEEKQEKLQFCIRWLIKTEYVFNTIRELGYKLETEEDFVKLLMMENTENEV